jgi:hypothetical protein
MPPIMPGPLDGVPHMPVALNGLPLMSDIASDTPLPTADHAKYATNNANNARRNHFDPLGTPPVRPVQNAKEACHSMMLNGLPHIPDIKSSHTPTRPPLCSSSSSYNNNPSEDPFDEIVRMSHSQMQDYD